MNERYIIRLENEFAIALRFNLRTGYVVLGGMIRFREEIEMFITEYFGVDIPDPSFAVARKIRYTFRISKKAFDVSLGKLKANGLVEKVQDHGRLMR